jgi:hypothetical protein
MMKEIVSLKTRVENLENDTNERKKYRITAEILTPIVRRIRAAMVDQGIPDPYYSKLMIKAYNDL